MIFLDDDVDKNDITRKFESLGPGIQETYLKDRGMLGAPITKMNWTSSYPARIGVMSKVSWII